MTERQQREAREKIARELAAFRQRGGKVQHVPFGMSGRKPYNGGGHKALTLGALSGAENRRVRYANQRQVSPGARRAT